MTPDKGAPEKAGWYESHPGGVACLLCPHACILKDGASGVCRVRRAVKGGLELPFFGRLSAVAMDPIEKKPLYHFHPGAPVLSVGFYGCNLRCPFCQNYSISQEFKAGAERSSPADVVRAAQRESSFGIAYTYSEPLVHHEFVTACSHLARQNGLKNILVTNGYLNPQPARELLALTDAVNVDLKSFSDDFYRKELGGGLQPVLDFIALAAGACHIEITTLIIPGRNDSREEIASIASFIAGIDRDIPLHLSCYFPRYKYSLRSTTFSDLQPLLAEARSRLRYVYAGNAAGASDTVCPQCGAKIIERTGYVVHFHRDDPGWCESCGYRAPVRF